MDNQPVIPPVAVVIPAFNAARYLRQTLESLAGQSHRAFDCIIVNNASTDQTVEIAQAFIAGDSRFRLVHQSSRGVCNARNAGLANIKSGTPFVSFLDADDCWLPSTLTTLVESLQAHPQSPAVHGSARFIDAQSQPINSPELQPRLERRLVTDQGWQLQNSDEPTTWQTLASWPCIITTGVVLARVQAIQKIEGWNSDLSIGEDWELWYRLSLLGPIHFIPQTLLDYRIHSTSASASWSRARRLADARRCVFNSPANTPDQRHYARRAFRVMSRYLGMTRIREGTRALTSFRLKDGAISIVRGCINIALSCKPWL